MRALKILFQAAAWIGVAAFLGCVYGWLGWIMLFEGDY